MIYSTARSVFAGCHNCNGTDAIWFAANAQGVAARHAKAHGHSTWVETAMTITYNPAPTDTETKSEGEG